MLYKSKTKNHKPSRQMIKNNKYTPNKKKQTNKQFPDQLKEKI